MKEITLKEAIWMGVIVGALWGPGALVLNSVTGAFPIEGGLLHNLSAFIIGGALLGGVTGGFLGLTSGVLPVKNIFVKAVIVSLGLWLTLRLGGTLLSVMDHNRYHQSVPQGIQGFILALAMGIFMGLLWKKKLKD